MTLDAARKHLLNMLAIAATLFVAAVIISDIYKGGYEVGMVEVPATLAASISGDTVAAELRDGIGIGWRKASNSSPINLIQKDADEPAITISGTNLPLRYVAKLLRKLAGVPIVEFSGEMLPASQPALVAATPDPAPGSQASDPIVRLILRSNTGAANPFFDETAPADQVVDDASLALLSQIDPYVAIVAGSQGTHAQRQRALRLAKETLVRASEGSRGQAYLAEGTALYQLERPDEAEKLFKNAIDELKNQKGDQRLLAVAYDGLAIVYAGTQNWERAREAVRNSLAAQPDYDSAKYHEIEIDDRIAKTFYGFEGLGDACQAERSYHTALGGYEQFLKQHPGFSIAYTQQALMRFLRLNWRRKPDHHLAVCGNVPAPAPLKDEITEAKRAFDDAVAEDTENYNAWYQSANLLYELQDPQYAESETDPVKQLALVAESVDRYRSGARLDVADFYFWYRYGEALVRLSELLPARAQAAQAEAVTAYCRSMQTNLRDTGYLDSAKDMIARLHGDCSDRVASYPEAAK
jgi:tetratricopeptide (TPR) repeat protein